MLRLSNPAWVSNRRRLSSLRPLQQSSASSSRPALTLPVQGQGAMGGLREQHEQSRLRKEKTEGQSKTGVGDCEPCEDSRCVCSAQTNTFS